MGQRIAMLPCIFSSEALTQAILTSQKVLSEELDALVPEEVLSVSSTMKTPVVPTLIGRVPDKSCHSGLRWQAREKKTSFLFPTLLLYQ